MTRSSTKFELSDPVERLMAFVRERYAIYRRRMAGDAPPWTEDPILRDYRFCNVYRENDRVTEWITENWRVPNAEDPDLWFAMCVARLQNQPSALEALGYPVPWDGANYLKKLRALKKQKQRVFNAAYIVSTNGMAIDKLEYLEKFVLTPLWQARERLRPRSGDTLNSYHMLLGQMQGFGSFMTAQVIADLKYVEPLYSAADWWTFAASGPGSRRGLNYVLGRDLREKWQEDDWRFEMGRLQNALIPMFASADMPMPDAQNIQNCLCEYSKYVRAVTIGQMPKQKYRWQ